MSHPRPSPLPPLARRLLRGRLTGLWRNGDFLLLWSGQTVSVFGSIVGGFALHLTAILTLQATPVEISLLRVAELGPVLVVGLFAGVWIDRLSRRRVMIAADVGRALALVTIPVAAALGLLRVEQLYAVAVAMSVCGLAFDVAYQAYLPSLVRREQLLEGNSKLQASSSTAEVSGFGIAGVLVQVLTAPVTILVDAASFLVSVATLALIRRPEPAPSADSVPAGESLDPVASEAGAGALREMAAGLRVVLASPTLRALLAAEGLSSLFQNGIFGTIVGLFFVRELGLEPATMGVLFALGGVSSFLGAVAAEGLTRRWGLGPALVRGYFLSAAAALFIPLAGGPPALMLTLLALQQLLGDGAATLYIIGQTSLVQSSLPSGLLGRVNASFRLVGLGSMLLGSLVGGALGVAVGLRPTLILAVVGSALAVFCLVLSPVRGLKTPLIPNPSPDGRREQNDARSPLPQGEGQG